jgi:hypothetical protein
MGERVVAAVTTNGSHPAADPKAATTSVQEIASVHGSPLVTTFRTKVTPYTEEAGSPPNPSRERPTVAAAVANNGWPAAAVAHPHSRSSGWQGQPGQAVLAVGWRAGLDVSAGRDDSERHRAR